MYQCRPNCLSPSSTIPTDLHTNKVTHVHCVSSLGAQKKNNMHQKKKINGQPHAQKQNHIRTYTLFHGTHASIISSYTHAHNFMIHTHALLQIEILDRGNPAKPNGDLSWRNASKMDKPSERRLTHPSIRRPGQHWMWTVRSSSSPCLRWNTWRPRELMDVCSWRSGLVLGEWFSPRRQTQEALERKARDQRWKTRRKFLYSESLENKLPRTN